MTLHAPILSDMVWPALLLEQRLISVIPISVGLMTEGLALRFGGFELSLEQGGAGGHSDEYGLHNHRNSAHSPAWACVGILSQERCCTRFSIFANFTPGHGSRLSC